MPATKVVVNIPGERAYDVRIGSGVLQDLGASMRRVADVAASPRVVVVSDANVAPLYLDAARTSLERAGYAASDIVVPAGEESKSVDVAAELWEAFAELGLSRDCCVVALGGGVVGDLAAFCASTFMRGTAVVQVPTTLLSMVDSSVGGKTGINLNAGKNMAGTFKQPSFVCASTDVLSTLPEREWACGCAEVVKSAAVDAGDFFFWLMEHADALWERNPDAVAEAIARCVVFKAGVVAEDKTESRGVRECLNYGHTLAHAIEKLSGYGTHSHGAAVAEGMRFACLLGARLVDTNADFAAAQGRLLDALGLPPLVWRAPAADILETMKHDKKARRGHVRFVLMRDAGDWVLEDVDDAVILAALREWGAK